jgi:hypothetical protein
VAEVSPSLVVLGSTLSNGAVVLERGTAEYLIVPFLDLDVEYADAKCKTLLEICQELAGRPS